MTRHLILAIAALALTLPIPLLAQSPIELEIVQPTPRIQDTNFRLANQTGFSVSLVLPDEYRAFGTSTDQRIKWNSSLNGFNDLFFDTNLCDSHGSVDHRGDPRFWDDRCIDAIGLFTKHISCVGDRPCEWGGTWNAKPGSTNMSVFPETWLWPKTAAYGSPNYQPILHKGSVNSVALSPGGTTCSTGYPCPPKSGQETTCNPSNPDSYTTGVANAKAVQVYYSGGVSRWFMAFNSQIHYDHPSSASDKWRILWAYSDDGQNWVVHPQILFRSSQEANPGFCGLGFLVSSLFIDTGHFYVTFTDVASSNVYMARSRIDFPDQLPGYSGGWSVASYPVVNGQWSWQPVTLGAQLDLPALGAANVLPNPFGGDNVFKVRQSAVGRIFTSASPGSDSRYIGLGSDVVGGSPVLQVFSTPSLDQPFQYESSVDLSSITIAGNGLEVGFTHHHDNLPSSPRLIGDQLDLWITQNHQDPSYWWDPYRRQMLTRVTARMKGGIYGP